MTIDISQFKQTFFEESYEGLDLMETNLLNLDMETVDEETISSIFRAAHSIKGGSGTFGMSDIGVFTHDMETLLGEIRDGHISFTKDIINVLLSSVDYLREMIEIEVNDGSQNLAKSEQLGNQLKAIISSAGQSVECDEIVNDVEETQNIIETNSDNRWKIEFSPYLDLLSTGNEPTRMFRELEELGELEVNVNSSELPDFDELEPESCYLKWILFLTGKIEENDIYEIFEWVEDECDLSIVLENPPVEVATEEDPDSSKIVAVDSEEAKPSVKSVAKKDKTEQVSSIRVSTDKVDDLVNLLGELVITQSMLGDIGKNFNMERMDQLKDGLNQLERSTRELQSSVMNIRMLPISSVFNRVPRLIHDLGQKLNKKVELEIIGAETELDKTVLGKIGDPLVHLVRNSLDHGLEIPEKRLKKGKSEVGKLTLEAVNQVGSIIIKITDDGNGLNRDILFKKACEKGIANETDELTDEQVFEFIFHPGFSTAKEVSDVSGRGVGMDVVRRNIRALGGHVHVKSEYGVGTTFTMKLPLTMAILDGQLLSVGKQTYIIQLISIVESIQVKEEYIKEMAGQAELYQLRGEYISIIRLHEVFGVETNKRKLTEGLLVVVESDNEKIGLFIDDLMGQQQVVIKSLDTNFKPVAGVSGATILGDGTVSLILDVTELINMSRQKNTVYRSVEQSQVIEHRA